MICARDNFHDYVTGLELFEGRVTYGSVAGFLEAVRGDLLERSGASNVTSARMREHCLLERDITTLEVVFDSSDWTGR